MKNSKVNGRRRSKRMLLACIGALVSIVFLILRKLGADFLTNVRFNTISGLCAVLPVVFFINRRADEGILCSFAMLIAEIIQIIVLLGGFSNGMGGLVYMLIATGVIAALGILTSIFMKKSTSFAVFIPVAFAVFILAFAVRMLFYALVMLGESFSINYFMQILSASLSTVIYWIVLFALTVLAAILKGPVEQKEEKVKAVKEKSLTVKTKAPEKQEIKPLKSEKIEKTVEKEKPAEAEPVPAKPTDEYPEAVGGCEPTSAPKRYVAPELSFFQSYDSDSAVGPGEEDEQAVAIENCLKEYGVVVNYLQSIHGPSYTRYEFGVGPGVQLNKITSREKELSYALFGKKIRILAPIPGKKAIGIEVPNDERVTIGFGNALENLEKKKKFKDASVPMVLGMTIDGNYAFTDVATMPHMVIAGTTGSGKSVCINSLLNSILYMKSPEQVRLILVDPKYVEMSVYDGIPHLLIPVITEMDKVLPMLEWLISEMDRRYKLLSSYKVRDLASMNSIIESKKLNLEKIPYIVTVIDEVADLMASAGKDVDSAVSRLAAKARAVGIHLVLATQRPSADVITGTLKSNLPGRVAFAVSSGINSKIILDQQGAENLLGKGDMLFLDPAVGDLQRIQGVLITGDEVRRVVDYVQEKNKVKKGRK